MGFLEIFRKKQPSRLVMRLVDEEEMARRQEEYGRLFSGKKRPRAEIARVANLVEDIRSADPDSREKAEKAMLKEAIEDGQRSRQKLIKLGIKPTDVITEGELNKLARLVAKQRIDIDPNMLTGVNQRMLAGTINFSSLLFEETFEENDVKKTPRSLGRFKRKRRRKEKKILKTYQPKIIFCDRLKHSAFFQNEIILPLLFFFFPK